MQKASASGGLIPQALYRGFAPGPHWETSIPYTLLLHVPLSWNPEYTPGIYTTSSQSKWCSQM